MSAKQNKSIASMAVPLVTAFMLVVSMVVTGRAAEIRSMTLQGSVNPGSAAWFLRELDDVNQAGDELLLVELDTPGGLVSSLRQMVQGVLSSDVPVVVYVAPSGAQAASAGALLLLASHVAAMAPGTEAGAAHPVGLGGQADEESVMAKKIENDLAAFARSLAQQRGRSPEWAERAVRESIASTASEAHEAGVIDMVATRREELLAFLDEKKVETSSGEVTIHTEGVPVVQAEPTFREKVMMTIADPNIASFLLLAGLAGLYFELTNPGALFPGVAGVIALLLGAWALQLLSVSVTGILLIVLAVLFLSLEIFVSSGGVLAIAGLVALFIGSVMVFEAPESGLIINWWFFLPLYLSFSTIVLLLVFVVLRSTRRKAVSGTEELIGMNCTVERAIEVGKSGKVFVMGELWEARSDSPIPTGAQVTVTGVEGMTLNVKQTAKE